MNSEQVANSLKNIQDNLAAAAANKPEVKPKKKSIFGLAEEYEQLMLDLEEAEGVLDDDLIKRMTIGEKELDDKLSNYRFILKVIESKNLIFKDYIAEYEAKIKRNEKSIERIKDYLNIALDVFGETPTDKHGNPKSKTLEYSEGKLMFIKTAPVQIIAENVLPDKYFKTTFQLSREDYAKLPENVKLLAYSTKHEVDKTSVKNDLKNGVVLDGAILDDNAGYIRFYV